MPERIRTLISTVCSKATCLASLSLLVISSTLAICVSISSVVYADTLGYPWPTDTEAPCYYGTSGGSSCVNPSDPTNQSYWYSWGVYDGNGTFHFYRNGYEYRNCTDYTQWKESTIGVSVPGTWGNGGQWYGNAPSNEQSTTAKPWDAAVVPGTIGHVAFVESVNSDGTITVSEYNHDTQGHGDTRTATPSNMGFTKYVDFGVHPSGGGGSIYGPARSDIDHNGMSDLIMTTQQSVGTGVYAMLGTGNGFTLPAGWLDLSPYGWSGVTPLVGHENGNTSYADYVFIADEGANGINVYTAYSNGSSGFAAPVLRQSIPGMMYADIKASMGDVDHNGIADIILTKNESTGTGVYVMPGTGNGFLAPTKWLDLSGYGWSGVTPLVGHENGSTSYADYIFITNEGANGIKVFDALSNGSSGFAAPVLKQTLPGLMYAGIKASMGDVDFNGIADLVLTTSESTGTGVYVMPGTGNGFLAPAQWLDLPGYGWSGVTPLMGYVNASGNGKDDYVFITNEGANGIKVFEALSSGSGFGTPQLWWTGTGWMYAGIKPYLE